MYTLCPVDVGARASVCAVALLTFSGHEGPGPGAEADPEDTMYEPGIAAPPTPGMGAMLMAM
jgi:hypothetical protein